MGDWRGDDVNGEGGDTGGGFEFSWIFLKFWDR
jgi:hypothetical protein